MAINFTAIQTVNMNELAHLGQLGHPDGFDNPALDIVSKNDSSALVEGTGGFSFLFTGILQGIGNNINDDSTLTGLRVYKDGTTTGTHDLYVITNFAVKASDLDELSSISALLDGKDNVNGSAGGDLLRGFGGDDTVKGKNGADVVRGDGGDDKLFGGKGADDMTGGAGKDKFYLTDQINGSDEITDFNTSNDLIYLSRELFAGIGTVGEQLASNRFKVGNNATTDKHRIIYDQNATGSKGFLFYDSNGQKAGGKVKICELDDGLNLKAVDFMIVA